MTLEWGRPAPGETDHELLWGLVGLAGALVAVVGWASGALLVPPCLFKGITGLPCVTCGSTRALAALAAGDLLAALRWNPLAVLASCALGVYVPYAASVGLGRAARPRVRFRPADWVWIRCSLVAVLVTTWGFLIVDGR